MTGWTRAARIPARLTRWINFVLASLHHWAKRFRPFHDVSLTLSHVSRRPVLLGLESLETRELLDSSFGGLATSSLISNAAKLQQDLETSAISLVNTAQPSPTNTATPAALENQLSTAWSVLTTDVNQTWQAVVQVKDAALQVFDQGLGTFFNDLGIHLPGLSPASAPPATNTSDSGNPADSGITVHPRTSPIIGDPPISATEGTEWNGQVATISDSDGDDQQYYGQNETISGTIDWGDGTGTTSFNQTVPDGQTANLFYGHMWMEAGSYTVTVSATDADGGSSQTTETATVGDGSLTWQQNPPNEWGQQFNTVPTITTPSAQTNTEGDNVSLQVQASDTDGDTVSYDALDLPPGLSINSSTGLISGTVAYGAAEDFGGTYNPTIIVADGQDGSSQASFSWTINQAQVAPVLTAPSNQTNVRGDNISLQLNSTQVDSDPISYAASNLPAGLSIDPDTGLISGTVDPSATLGTPYTVTVMATDDTTNLSSNQTFNWTVSPTNVAPALTSPGNQTNSAGDQVSLQLASTDADGDALTYTATGLPPGLTLDPIAGTISGTIPNSAASSTPYNVTLTASDGDASNSQSLTWMVNAVSLQNPGDQSNLDGDNVSLQMTGSDANNSTLTYSATGLPTGLSIGSSTGLISGTISSTADTSSPYSVTVTATDTNSDSVSQTFTWTVSRVSLNSVNNQENQEGASVSLQMSASGNEGTPTYSATGLPTGLSISSGGLISGTIGTAAHGSSPYQVTVTATDGTATSSQSFVWTVTPRVALVNPGPQSNATGDNVSLQLSATSPGGTMSYSATGLPPGLSINQTTGLITGSPTTSSTTPYTVTVTAGDGTSSSSQSFAWTVSVINLVSPGDQTSNDGDTVSLSLTKSYHGSGTLSYTATGLPTGLSINSGTGQITGTISGTADTNSPYTVTVTITDATNTSSQTFNWTVNAVVSIASISDQSNAAGDSVSLQVSASDTENKTMTYSATGLPSGLTINSSTGLISGTIAVGADTGSPYTTTVTATDSSGNSTSQSFNWTVAHVSLVNPGSQASLDGAIVSLQLQGHDADSDTISYTASGLPSGLSMNTSTGLISGTIASNADTNSPYAVTVTAKDSGGKNTTQTFLWTVSQVSLSAPSAQTNTEGDNVSLQLQGHASSGSLSYNAGGLPAGLSLNATTGLITGTIAAGDAANGPYTVDVSVSNGTVSTSYSFTWTINPIVSLTALADQSNNEGNNVSLQSSATDSLGRALTYTASGLPSGLSINSSTGLMTGTISSGDAANGPYAVTVTASDGTYSSSVSFSWTVTHTDTTALTMSNPGTQTNVAGDSIDLQINASDPDGIDTLIYSATGLPDGLSIDPFSGVISGVIGIDAVGPGASPVTVTANDGNGQTVSQTFNWTINDAPITIQAGPAISAVEGTDTGNITVATFTTTDPYYLNIEFTATVNWGDGNSDTAEVTGQNGVFSVIDSHVYPEKGTYTVSVTITDINETSVTSTANTATVGDAGLSITGGLELGDPWTNQAKSYTLATFTDANVDASVADFAATINWGDNTPVQTSAAYVQEGPNGSFLVVASHTYPDPWVFPSPDPASYSVSVTVTDLDGASASTSDTVVVGDIQAEKSAGMDWSFNDADPYATASDFVANGQQGMALVNWGDGTSNVAPITGGPGNGSGPVSFSIQASHVYADSMNQPSQHYQITVTVTDVDGNTLTGNEYVSVTRPPMTGTGDEIEGQPNTAVNNVQLAEFSVPDSGDGTGEFNATINWGDGNSSNGTIQEEGSGLFAVLGTHVYSTPGDYNITVDVQQGWSSFVLAQLLVSNAIISNNGNPSVHLWNLTPGVSPAEGGDTIHVEVLPPVPQNDIANNGQWQIIDKSTGQPLPYVSPVNATFGKSPADPLGRESLFGNIKLPTGFTYTNNRLRKIQKTQILLLPTGELEVKLVGAKIKQGNNTVPFNPKLVILKGITPPDGQPTQLGSKDVSVNGKTVGVVSAQYGTYTGERGKYTAVAAVFNSLGKSASLQAAAKSFGANGDHFSWYQVITKDNDPLYFQKTANSYVRLTVPYVDVPPGGYYEKETDPRTGKISYTPLPGTFDNLPWYYNENASLGRAASIGRLTDNGAVGYLDNPLNPEPTTISAETWLVVVDKDGNFVAWTDVGFSWTWTKKTAARNDIGDIGSVSWLSGAPDPASLPEKLFPPK